MSLHLTSTDNASLANKIELRKRATNIEQLKVLDLYSGNNTLWNHFCQAKVLRYRYSKRKGNGRANTIPVIYEPKGRANEYSPYACNLYIGCSHRCRYCYAPHALQRSADNYFRIIY